MENFTERTTGTKRIFEGRIINLRVDDVELPNGSMSKREIVEHPGGVCILAVTEENKIILVRQYRKPMDKVTLEIPAGKREKGEDPKVTAMRELEEETGYTCDDLEQIHAFYTSPGFANELIYLYKAVGLRKKENAAAQDEDEFVELLEIPAEEVTARMHDGEIQDAKTIIALQYYQLTKE